MGVSQQAASKSAAELETLGYLERTPIPATRACGGSVCSARGRAAIVAGRRPARRSRGELAAALGAERVEALRAALIDALDGGRAASRPCAAGACRHFASVSGCERNDQRHPLLRSRLPVGLVGLAASCGAAWRYGDQLAWRLALIGLAERAEDYAARGYTAAGGARRVPRASAASACRSTPSRGRARSRTGPACRAIVAARLIDPATELPAFRALQLARFTTTTLFDTDDGIRGALERVAGLDAGAVVAAIDDPATEAAYQADRALVRTAAGSPTEFQGKAADTDGAVRYTAPSLVVRAPRRAAPRGRRLPARRGLRRRDRQPRPGADAARAGRGRGRDPRRVPVPADDARGRRGDGPAPGRARRPAAEEHLIARPPTGGCARARRSAAARSGTWSDRRSAGSRTPRSRAGSRRSGRRRLVAAESSPRMRALGRGVDERRVAQHRLEALVVALALPAGDHHRRDAVADAVGQRAALAHDPVDADHERDADGDRLGA